jgi:flagellar hook-associated protein FlgK
LLNDTTGATIQAGPIPYNPAITNSLFPTPAVSAGVVTPLSNAGSLTAINVGDLTINGIAIPVPASDGISTTDASVSAIAIATAINGKKSQTGNVTATVNPNTINLGAYTGGSVAAGNFIINGVNITTTSTSVAGLISAINLQQGTTGVLATEDGSGNFILTAADGRNIEIKTNGTSPTANFANFSLTGGSALDKVQRSTIVLSSPDSDIVVAGTTPANATLTTGTYNRYDPGYQITLTGAVASGDTFHVNYNSNSVNDNRNGLALAGLESGKFLNNSKNTFSECYGQLVGQVGSVAQQSSNNSDAAKALLDQSQQQLSSAAGVNIDQETTNLLQYQQAYQACAQVLSVAREMIQTLFTSFGG